jgi:hypothetical protein
MKITNKSTINDFFGAKVVQAEDRTKRIYSFFMLRRRLPSSALALNVVQADYNGKK